MELEFNIIYFIIFSLISFITTFLITKYSNFFFSRSLLDEDFLKPQAFHKEPTARIGGFVILLFTGLVFIAINFKGSKIFVLIPTIIGLSIYLFFSLPEYIYLRLLETSSQVESGDFTNRETIWKEGFNAFIDSGRLLFGIGHNAFKTLMFNATGTGIAGHNTYLLTLIELGFIGFILYMRILLYLARKVWILVRRDSLFFLLLLIPLLISMLTLGL